MLETGELFHGATHEAFHIVEARSKGVEVRGESAQALAAAAMAAGTTPRRS